MSMTGFDPKWKDPADFIIGITKEIWEDRNIGSLTQPYQSARLRPWCTAMAA